MSSAYDQFRRTTRRLTRKPSASGGKSGSRLNSEGIDSLASPLTHPCPSGFAIYVARLPSAPFASTAFDISRWPLKPGFGQINVTLDQARHPARQAGDRRRHACRYSAFADLPRGRKERARMSQIAADLKR